ncbi:MAG: glycine cleavage system protein H [Candidatus Sumerlaeota bacterium]|nr:glycine cleavage system protein H [Candidatus Sumerlaeota bacterium]
MAELLGYNYPDELYYHREHAWVKLEDDGTLTVGMTDFSQESAGEIAYMDMPMEGDEVEQNGTLAKIQTAKWVGKLQAPVSGEVIEINPDVEDEPELVNEDAFANWICKMKPSNWDGEKGALLRTGTPEIEEWLKGEIARVEKEKGEAEKH